MAEQLQNMAGSRVKREPGGGGLNEFEEHKRDTLLRRFVRRLIHNWAAGISAVVLTIIVLAVIIAPSVMSQSPTDQSLLAQFGSPSSQHWLGTDQLGRDEFARLVYGGRVSLLIGVIGALGGLVIGTFLGLVTGYIGGWLDDIVMRVIDIMQSFPGVLLAILIAAVLSPGILTVMIALTIWFTPAFARITRGSVFSLRETDFVLAEHSVGATGSRILFRHILINAISPIIVYLTLSVATSILVAAALSFLGLGVQPPTAEWGAMVSDAQNYIQQVPGLILWPGLAIFVTVLSINILGDALQDVLNPRLRS